MVISIALAHLHEMRRATRCLPQTKPYIFMLACMKLTVIFILLSISLLGCTSKSTISHQDSTANSISISETEDSVTKEESNEDNTDVSSSPQERKNAVLVLSINELRYVDETTGSSREISLGTPEDQLLGVVNRLLNLKQPKIGINSECGVGPLKMVTWSNGLTVMFKKNKLNNIWEFVGWSVGSGTAQVPKITTMANIGIGSTRAEVEGAYAIKVDKTSLGHEFSTLAGGLYGIFSGPGKDATVTSLWSGTSCVFR